VKADLEAYLLGESMVLLGGHVYSTEDEKNTPGMVCDDTLHLTRVYTLFGSEVRPPKTEPLLDESSSSYRALSNVCNTVEKALQVVKNLKPANPEVDAAVNAARAKLELMSTKIASNNIFDMGRSFMDEEEEKQLKEKLDYIRSNAANLDPDQVLSNLIQGMEEFRRAGLGPSLLIPVESFFAGQRTLFSTFVLVPIVGIITVEFGVNGEFGHEGGQVRLTASQDGSAHGEAYIDPNLRIGVFGRATVGPRFASVGLEGEVALLDAILRAKVNLDVRKQKGLEVSLCYDLGFRKFQSGGGSINAGATVDTVLFGKKEKSWGIYRFEGDHRTGDATIAHACQAWNTDPLYSASSPIDLSGEGASDKSPCGPVFAGTGTSDPDKCPTIRDDDFPIMIKALYQEIWGRPIESKDFDYYMSFVFAPTTDLENIKPRTLEAVRADMKARHFQTVIVPVISVIPLLLQGQPRDTVTCQKEETTNILMATFQAVLGRAMQASEQQTYCNHLASGGTLAQVRQAIASGAEAYSSLAAIYQEVWKRPIDSGYLDYYTFLLATDGTLTDVRADMEALHIQTVVVPVLSIISVLLQ
jgi:hypothetical protein